MASDYVILYTQCIVERRGISQISGFRSGQRRLRYRMKKILKRTGKIFCLFLLIVVLVNILSPLFCRKPDETYVESLRKTEFTSETAGVERICCIDDNEEALLWRLRMIGTAKESIVLSTFDLRADDNGTKILAALNCAAARRSEEHNV